MTRSLLVRWHNDFRLRVLAYVVVAAGLVAILRPSREVIIVERWSPPVGSALRDWTEVASALIDTVPPKILLGASGDSPALDSALGSRGMSRTEFQKAAGTVTRAVSLSTDDASREALAAGFTSIPLPEGIDIPAARPPAHVVHNATVEAARDVVFELTARLQKSPSSPELP